MKLENAKQINLAEILEQIKKEKGNDNTIHNIVADYLKDCGEENTLADIKRWLDNMIGSEQSYINYDCNINQFDDLPVKLKSARPIKHKGLVKYLISKGIKIEVASRFMKEVLLVNTKTCNQFLALGVQNEEGGYELFNQFYKGTVNGNGISFIRGLKPKPTSIHIFSDTLDYSCLLSHLNVKALNEDAIILHRYSNLKKAKPYIKGYGYKMLYSWLENNKTGKQAALFIADFVKSQIDLKFKNMSVIYKSLISLKEWRISNIRSVT